MPRWSSLSGLSARHAWLPAIAAACLLVMAAEAPDVVVVPVPLIVAPLLQRVNLAPEAHGDATVTITAPVDATLLAAETDCRCLSLAIPLPVRLPAGTAVILPLAVSGVLSGVKTLTLRTTAGTVQAQVQVVSAGLGVGRDVLASALAAAGDGGFAAWFIVHDLRGALRNCGCSGGSLGGVEHLAALPAEVARLAPTVPTRFLLSGDSDGAHPGLGAALAKAGWGRDEQAVVVSGDPAAALAEPGAVVVIPTRPVALSHRRLLRPLLDGGTIVEIVLVAGDGRLIEHRSLPVDRTLPGQAAILAGFHERLSSKVVTAVPSQDCAGCHAAAHAAWGASRHAHAWESLPPADRTDACVTCHSTPTAVKTIAPGVQCQACHTGSAEHAASGGTRATSGTVDCRSCHSARHHPDFMPAAAWKAIEHGR